jgi:Holliday junction resolvase RusA-like endonuclease
MMTLLRPHRPAAPVDGPLDLAIAFTWPHLTSTRRADRARHLPKATRPDADNIAKAAIDCLVKLQFMRDDGQVARLTVEKFHGPAELVGIRIKLAPMVAF